MRVFFSVKAQQAILTRSKKQALVQKIAAEESMSVVYLLLTECAIFVAIKFVERRLKTADVFTV